MTFEHKYIMYLKQKGRCYYCGSRFSIRKMTKDHLVPKGKGGSDSLSNYVLACYPCNHEKGDMLYNEYMKLITSRNELQLNKT